MHVGPPRPLFHLFSTLQKLQIFTTINVKKCPYGAPDSNPPPSRQGSPPTRPGLPPNANLRGHSQSICIKCETTYIIVKLFKKISLKYRSTEASIGYPLQATTTTTAGKSKKLIDSLRRFLSQWTGSGSAHVINLLQNIHTPTRFIFFPLSYPHFV